MSLEIIEGKNYPFIVIICIKIYDHSEKITEKILEKLGRTGKEGK